MEVELWGWKGRPGIQRPADISAFAGEVEEFNLVGTHIFL